MWEEVLIHLHLKKNIMDLSIPFLAKAAVNVGGGFGSHAATKRVNVDMVRKLLDERFIKCKPRGFRRLKLEDFLT